MSQLNWNPPPIAAVRAFVAAAEALSFSSAAEQLHVTPSAISHAIRELEARLQTRLFDREGGRTALSSAGRLYLPFAREALDRLKAGEASLARRDPNPHVLTVSVSPTFAAKWLVPKLGAFSSEHPDLDLRISAALQRVDLEVEDIDLAVRHGDGLWPRLNVVRLSADTIFPVCNPALLGPSKQLGSLDLSRFPLIHHRDAGDWADWLTWAGLEPPANLRHGPVFNEMSLAIDAAVAGQGIALARSALVAADLSSGRLVRPLPQAMPASLSYWIVCRPSAADLPKIVRFRGWLLREARADDAALDRSGTRPDENATGGSTALPIDPPPRHPV